MIYCLILWSIDWTVDQRNEDVPGITVRIDVHGPAGLQDQGQQSREEQQEHDEDNEDAKDVWDRIDIGFSVGESDDYDTKLWLIASKTQSSSRFLNQSNPLYYCCIALFNP